MKYLSLISIYLLAVTTTFSQNPSSTFILDESIKYHDPKGEWFQTDFQMTFEQSRPDGSTSQVSTYINNPKSQFTYLQDKKDAKKEYFIKNEQDECVVKFNNSETFSEDEAKKHRLNCETAIRIRNYYTYLWGLPMKLKDPGTIISNEVKVESFENVDCYKLKVTYDAEVGKDIWYFYFKKSNYALHGYKFYHEESKNDGEYITLEAEEKVGNMKLPKTRKWYYNKDNKFLGADKLLKQ